MSSSCPVMRGIALAHAPIVLTARPTVSAVDAAQDIVADPEDEAARLRDEAAAVLAAARREAEEVLRRAQAEAEDAARLAREQGYADGLQQAEQDMASRTAAVRDEAHALLHSAEGVRREILAEIDGEIRELALAIAEQLVGCQLSLDPGVVESIAGQALRLARDRERVVLFVHPDDAVLLREREEDLRSLLSPGASLRIAEDAGLERGGCLVDTGEGLVDARLKSRWQALREVLER